MTLTIQTNSLRYYTKESGVRNPKVFFMTHTNSKSFRDGLQKALWVHKDNPNKEYLREALQK